MTYKKYIKRGGKVYGPYIYHSKRVNGKVVSEYHGIDSKKIDYKKFLWISLSVLVLVILIFGIYYLGKSISGKATYDLDIKYKEGEAIDGTLKFSLKEGELLPSSSLLIFENNGRKYEYVLSDIISDEKIKGDFYVEGKNISGSGKGYGIPGTKEIYPPVYFDLEIYSQEKSETEDTSEEIEQSESSEQTEEETVSPSEIQEEADEQTKEETNSESVTDETSNEQTSSEATEETIEDELGITGQAVSFLFGWMATGNVVMELEKEVNGEVSANEPFEYFLNQGEEVEIKSKSVRTNSKELKNNDIELEINENKAIITTDYSEKEEGFGEEYLGEDTISLELDLSDLNLILNSGELKMSLIYSEQEIVSLTTTLKEKEKIKEKGEEIVKEDIPEIEEEMPVEIIPELEIFLTEQERAILINEFGSTKIKKVRDEIYPEEGILKIGYRIREYSIEHVYEYPQNKEILDAQIEADRIKWLKDIATNLIKKEKVSQQANSTDESFSI